MFIERAVVLCESETFSVDETWLKPEGHRLSGSVVPLGATLAEHEKEIIEAALADCGGRVSWPYWRRCQARTPETDA